MGFNGARLAAARLAAGLTQEQLAAEIASDQARVSEWDGGRGRVVLHGSLWSATGPAELTPGDDVVVTHAVGLVLQVEAVQSAHG